jgi:hypothetical protein
VLPEGGRNPQGREDPWKALTSDWDSCEKPELLLEYGTEAERSKDETLPFLLSTCQAPTV